MKFPESALAHKYLDGLQGIEIGGAAHNSFGLNTINVDRVGDMNSHFKITEVELCGEALQVDVVAECNKLPFADKSYDFVISSHVIEHFYDPISALLEWARVARRYIFIIVPHRQRTFDADKKLTKVRSFANVILRSLLLRMKPEGCIGRCSKCPISMSCVCCVD